MVYKMSRGTAKISKEVFWIKKDGETFTIDNDREKIDQQKTKKGTSMFYYKEYKAKADYMFTNLYHQIFTFEQTL